MIKTTPPMKHWKKEIVKNTCTIIIPLFLKIRKFFKGVSKIKKKKKTSFLFLSMKFQWSFYVYIFLSVKSKKNRNLRT